MIIYFFNKFNILFKYNNNIDNYFINDNKYFFDFYFKSTKNKSLIFHTLKNLIDNPNKNITSINEIFLSSKCRFGNCIIYLNNYISLCKIIGCKIILLDKKYFWFIKNNIILKNNIELKVGDRKNFKNFLNLKIFFDNYFFQSGINIILLRFEIIKNLPKINISKKDLYIHIRSEDIFKRKDIINEHIEPPLCFYKNILNNFLFDNIIILSFDNLNPVITKLINYYPKIIFRKNKLALDISYLLNAYNLVSSLSSFFIGSLQLNYNIKFLWDYNSYHMKIKNLVLHYDLYNYPNRNIIIYRMEPSKIYKKVLYLWKNNKKQIKLMLKDKCPNNFSIMLYNTGK